jgi:gluconokinase
MENAGQLARSIRIIILMGVSGAGKTTIGKLLARDLGWEFYEGDDFHPLMNVDKMRRGLSLDDEARAPWLQALRTLIHDLLDRSQHAVITCSALKQAYRKELTKGYSHVAFVYLQGSYALISRRLRSRRDHFMNPELLASQFKTLEEPHDIPMVDIDHPPDIIVRHIKQRLELTPT